MNKTVLLAAFGILLLGGTAWIAVAEDWAEREFLLGIRTHAKLSSEQQDAVVSSLDEKPRWLVRASATFLRIKEGAADVVLGEHRPTKMGSAKVIPEDLARRLLAGGRGHGPIGPEPLPPLVIGNGVTGRLTSGGVQPYVQDYDDPGRDGKSRGAAIFGQLEDGVRLDLTPKRKDDGMVVAVHLAWAEVVQPVPVFEAGGTGQVVRIELPELQFVEQRSEVELPTKGGFVLAGRGFAWDQKTVRVVLLEVRPHGR